MRSGSNRIAIIEESICIGCGRCLRACPFDVIDMENDKAIILEDGCRGCMACAPACPVDAIRHS